jgi:enolase
MFMPVKYSRVNTTIEVDIITKNGGRGRASVPSVISKYEVVEIRDGGSFKSG